jgi:Ca2+-binding EF-hand superfamily protein
MNYNTINKKYNENYNDIVSKEEENRNMNNIGNMNYTRDPYYRPRITPDSKGVKLFKRIIYNPITKELLYSNGRYNNNNEHNIINENENQSLMKRYKNNKFLFDQEKYNEQKLIELFNKFRNTIISKGDKSIFNLQKLLYEFNTDCHPFLISFENFLEIIQKLGINNFTIEEIRKIFIFLDNNKTGYINYDIFFRNLVGYMRRNRQALVRTIYESLRKDQYGNIFYVDFKQLFNADKYNVD